MATASESGRYNGFASTELECATLYAGRGKPRPLQRMEEGPLPSHRLTHGGLAGLKPGAYICLLARCPVVHPRKTQGRFGKNF
jgi:hypothetical protein